MPKTVRRHVPMPLAIAAALVAALALPAGAAAVPGDALGGLLQGPHRTAEHACISQQPTTGCGTAANGGLVNGGLGGAHGVAMSANGKNVYVASENGALSLFGRDANTGILTYQGCIKDPGSTEACATNSLHTGDLAGAHSVGVSPDDKFVYVAASTATSDSITVFSRNPANGALTPVAGTDGCISETPPVIGCATAVAGLAGVAYLTVTQGDVYAVSPDNSTLVRFTRNSMTGGLGLADPETDCFRGTGSEELTCGTGERPALEAASSVAMTPDGASVYVASRSSNAVAAFARDELGKLTYSTCLHGRNASDCPTLGDVPGLNGAQGIAVTNDNVYVASGDGGEANTGHALVQFDRDPLGGLTPDQCLRDPGSTAEPMGCTTALGLVGAHAIAISSDGKFLYVAAASGNDVAEFSRDLASGELGQLAGSDACVGQIAPPACPTDNRGGKGIAGASSIVAPGSGATNPNHVYVTSPSEDAIAEFRIERAPQCSSPTVTAQHDQRTPLNLATYCQDPNGDLLTFSRFSNPANGTLSGNPDGMFRYTPRPRFGGGNDSFTFRANDGHVFSNVATLTLSVPPISADHTKPTVHLHDVPADISKHDLTHTGVTFTEEANERVTFRNALLSSPHELGRGSSRSYSIVLDTQNWGFGFGPRSVVLVPSGQDVAGVSRFKVKVRIVAKDANGNTRTRTKTVQVHP